MNRRSNQLLWSVSFLFLSATVQAQESSGAIPFPGGKPSVQIFASISTKDGSTAPLDSAAFNVLLDKQQAQVVSLRPAKDETLLFAVMVDSSASGRQQGQAIKDAAVGIFQGLLNDRSHGYLVLVDQTVQTGKRPLQPAEVQATIDKIGFGGGTALYDGIAQTCSQALARSQNPDAPRRVLILISDGDDNYSHLTLAKAEDAAEREGVAVFSLATSRSSREGEAILGQVSKDTGGRAIVVNQLSEGIALLLAAIQGQSILSIVPSQAADQKLHSLVVRTTEKDLSVSVPARVLLR